MNNNNLLSKTIKLLSIISIFLLVGCKDAHTPKYNISIDNIQKIKELRQKVSINKFEYLENKKYIKCRGNGIILPPDEKSFAKYIEQGFKSELSLAGKYDLHSNYTISVQIKNINLRTFAPSYWEINSDILINNEYKYVVNSRTEIKSFFTAQSACEEAQYKFPEVVNNYINKLVSVLINNQQS